MLATRATVAVVPDGELAGLDGWAGGAVTADDDQRLVARVRAGDEQALARLYDRYSGLVFGLARKVTGTVAVAEEITQEVFVHFWEHSDRFDADRGSLRAYLGSITHRRSVDAVRRDTRRSAREARDQNEGSAVASTVDLADRAAARDL